MNHPLVAVGIGNTTITFGIGESSGDRQPSQPAEDRTQWNWAQLVTVETAGFDPAEVPLAIPPSASWRVASVHRPSEQRLADWVRESNANASYRALRAVDLPINVCVERPERVGLDRLVAAVAVNQLRETHSPAVIVDAGTAITVDLVSRQGDFLGGAILPGMRIVSHALSANTDLLPQVDPRFQQSVPDALGKSTDAAIRSGLFWGSVGAIRELVERIGKSTEGLPQVFLTGGDAESLAPFISKDAVFVPDLVIGGILAATAM
jgi:type III pantothenate kinase